MRPPEASVSNDKAFASSASRTRTAAPGSSRAMYSTISARSRAAIVAHSTRRRRLIPGEADDEAARRPPLAGRPAARACPPHLGRSASAAVWPAVTPVSYTHLRAHETVLDLV